MRSLSVSSLRLKYSCYNFKGDQLPTPSRLHRRREMQSGHVGGPSFRWALPGAAPSMCRQQSWSLEVPDLLSNFFALLPAPPGGMIKQDIFNRKGGKAELFVLKYEKVDEGCSRLWHGTTAGGLRGILREGFKESSDDALHEFSVSGFYATDNPQDALDPYAISTQFAETWCWEMPYVRVVLLVQATGPCIRKRGSEVIFRAAQIRLKEAHVIRGYDFENRGDKYCNLSKENVPIFFIFPFFVFPFFFFVFRYFVFVFVILFFERQRSADICGYLRGSVASYSGTSAVYMRRRRNATQKNHHRYFIINFIFHIIVITINVIRIQASVYILAHIVFLGGPSGGATTAHQAGHHRSAALSFSPQLAPVMQSPTALRDDHTGGPGYRWALKGASTSMKLSKSGTSPRTTTWRVSSRRSLNRFAYRSNLSRT